MALSFAPSLPYFPTTFLERGAAVPFTTPVLSGTRVRPGERAGLELIVPNPSGGRGQYILPWGALQDLCRPTLYDRRLQKAVEEVRGVTPSAIRRITRDAAAEGLAGREARNAASEAVKRDEAALLVTNFHLLLALVHEVTPGAVEMGPLASPEAVERAAKLAVAKVAPSLGLDPHGVARALEELAAVYVGIGLGPEPDGRLPRAMNRLRDMQRSMEEYVVESGGGPIEAVNLVCSCAELTLTCALATLDDARRLPMRPVALLTSWQTNPDRTAAKVVRPEWIMDGWDTICAMWEAAQTRIARRDALAEISHFTPIMPREASEWVNQLDVEAQASSLFRRVVALNHDWRSGARVARQPAQGEHFLAVSH